MADPFVRGEDETNATRPPEQELLGWGIGYAANTSPRRSRVVSVCMSVPVRVGIGSLLSLNLSLEPGCGSRVAAAPEWQHSWLLA